MIVCGEQGNERIEFARGRGKPVQQHQGRRVFRASFPIEDANAIDRRAVIRRCGGRGLQWSSLRRTTSIPTRTHLNPSSSLARWVDLPGGWAAAPTVAALCCKLIFSRQVKLV